MMYIALAAGLGIGYWLGRRLSNHVLIYYYFSDKKTEDRFLDFYDINEQKVFYHIHTEVMDRVEITYSSYLKQLQKKREGAYEKYRSVLKSMVSHDIQRVIGFVLLPIVIFQESYPIFILGFTAYLLGWIVYRRYVKQNDITFYGPLVIGLILDLNPTQNTKNQ